MYGNVVRKARRARGLTQTQLAEISGIEQTNISAIERDRRLPSIATLHQLLMACGFELVAMAGDKVIGFPASLDDVYPDGVEPEPPLDVSSKTRNRMVLAALEASELVVRSR